MVEGNERTRSGDPGILAFTLCSNNYLAHAKTLGDSFIRYCPCGRFVIGLVDVQRDDIDYGSLGPFDVLPVEDVAIPQFRSFWERYNIVELNTAVKPFYFEYLLKSANVDVVLYFDPDVEFFGPCAAILDELGSAGVLLAPHVLTPVPDDGLRPSESLFLQFGTYNLGFLAAVDRPATWQFLDWWKARTAQWGYARTEDGLFVDQLWMNLAPIFFEGFRITRHAGIDVAYWNLHERRLSKHEGRWFVNGSVPLVFYHFSAFNPEQPSLIARWQERFQLTDRPDVEELMCSYIARLFHNGYERYRSLPCDFTERRNAMRLERDRRFRKHNLVTYPVSFTANRVALRLLGFLRRSLDKLHAELCKQFPRGCCDEGSPDEPK